MQKKKWVRVSLAVAIVGGAAGAMSAAGCSGDDTTGAPGVDAGKDSSMVTGDSSTTGDSSATDSSSSTDADAAPMLPNAKVYLVHAAADTLTRPLRFCFGLNPNATGGSTVAGGIFPFPDTVTVPIPGAVAGLYPGFGGSTSSSKQLQSFNLSTLSIALYALDATQISTDTADAGSSEVPCEDLIGSDALGASADGGKSAMGGVLTLNTQFWYLGTIAKGTLANGTTWVAAVTGCFPGETADEADYCPTMPAYNMATGNLALTPWQVDNTTVVAADGGIGAQFANASPAWDTINAQATGVTTAAGFWIETPAVIPDGGAEGGTGSGEAGTDGGATDGGGVTDAGSPQPTLSFIPITSTGTFGKLSPATLATVPVPLNVATAGFFSAFASATGSITYPPGCTPGVSCASPFLLPLPAIDQITNGTVTGEFVDGKGYVFILVGDPLNPTYINPTDGGAATSTTGVFNGASAHFLAFPTSNP